MLKCLKIQKNVGNDIENRFDLTNWKYYTSYGYTSAADFHAHYKPYEC